MARIGVTLGLFACLGTLGIAQDHDASRPRVEVKDPSSFHATQGRPLYSGPQPGEPLPAFEAVGIRGAQDGKAFDPVESAGGAPQVLVFQGGTEGLRGVLALTRALPTIIEQSGKPMAISVILMDDDQNASEDLARRISPYLGREVTLGYTTEGRDGPGIYGLNRNVSQTILFARDGVVTRSFAFPQGAAHADPHVLGALAELVGADRETFATWMARVQAQDGRMQRRPGADRPADRPEPEDRPGNARRSDAESSRATRPGG